MGHLFGTPYLKKKDIVKIEREPRTSQLANFQLSWTYGAHVTSALPNATAIVRGQKPTWFDIPHSSFNHIVLLLSVTCVIHNSNRYNTIQ